MLATWVKTLYTRKLRCHLLLNKSGSLKQAKWTDFVVKSRTILYSLSIRSAATIHNLQKLFVAGKTCDNAIQLLLQQCCKTLICTFLVARFTYEVWNSANSLFKWRFCRRRRRRDWLSSVWHTLELLDRDFLAVDRDKERDLLKPVL